MKVTVEHEGSAPETYTVKDVTIVTFERQFNVGLGVLADAATIRMEYVDFIGYDCERRSGKIVKPFDGWLEDVSVTMEEEPAPLVGAVPSPASLPVSA